QPEIFDKIAWVLSVFKDDNEVRAELAKLSLPNREALTDALLNIRFDKFHALSLKALRAIVPHMEQGQRYDEACVQAGYHHSQLYKVGEGEHKYLPPLYSGRDDGGRMIFTEDADIPRNPVVLRSLNQARKVVNAIIRRYGSPAAVHIEMARDLSRPFDERNKIKKDQDEYQARNQRDREQFIELFGHPPKGLEFEKWRLYREQNAQCAYSQKPLCSSGNVAEIFLEGSTEIDHALPYSRSFDDSKNNKVLVLTRENRDKGNRTPFEYLGGMENSERWQRFVSFVESNKSYRLAKRTRLLRKDFGTKESEEFRERNLYDTRYVCRFFKNYVEQHLKLAEGSTTKRCVVVSGQLTNFLRARWGLLKVRSDSDRHHALDAAVVAACNHSMVQRLSNYSRNRELEQVRDGFVNIETGEIINPAMHQQLREHFPDPWPYFRHELEARLKIDSPELLREEMARLGSYTEEELAALKPMFVSRAPQRRNGGAAHKDTIYGQPEKMKENGSVTQKIALSNMTLKDLDLLADPHRNVKLYAAIRERLEAHGGKGDKAFPVSNPLRKPDKEGNPTGPIVRTVTKVIDKLSGISVRGGIAKNDSMLRVDIFTKASKFHLVPVYVHHLVTGLPNRAVVGKKDESHWASIDSTYQFEFSLYPNDLFSLKVDGEAIFGYFSGININDCGLKYFPHDQKSVESLRKKGISSAKEFRKFNVDVLGNIYPAPPEKRRGLA
ncbi:MAG: type II CRISPR RNA-guided endonuclease Cas9, partial [Azonexus sp.]